MAELGLQVHNVHYFYLVDKRGALIPGITSILNVLTKSWAIKRMPKKSFQFPYAGQACLCRNRDCKLTGG